MINSVPRDGRLPVVISKRNTVTRALPIADDIPASANRIRQLRLRLYLDFLREGDLVSVSLNGAELSVAREQPQWLACDVPADLMRHGENDLAVTFARGASWELTLRSVELTVRYKQG